MLKHRTYPLNRLPNQLKGKDNYTSRKKKTTEAAFYKNYELNIFMRRVLSSDKHLNSTIFQLHIE